MINHLLPTGACTLDTVAAQPNLHSKALQRRLTAEETSFDALIDEQCRQRGQQLLADTGIGVSQLAAVLGQAEPSVLIRACRRWFGCPPAAYRRHARSAGQTESA